MFLGYYIEKKEISSDIWQKCNHTICPTTMYNIPHLIEDREYEFRIIAVNEAGNSKPSMCSRRVKVKDPNGMFFFII